jgi:DNA repair protein RAD50
VLQQVEKAIEDHEAFKKNLRDNLDIIYTTQHIEKLEKEVASMKIERTSIEGHETVYDDFETLRHRQTTTGKAIARLEGRRGEILESIRSVKVRTYGFPFCSSRCFFFSLPYYIVLQRKLLSPEYKNVDEEYRVATIKLETTQLAVKDLEKYHNALDKALLKFHSLKIAEINKIIRDLWTLTYKGEDITR